MSTRVSSFTYFASMQRATVVAALLLSVFSQAQLPPPTTSRSPATPATPPAAAPPAAPVPVPPPAPAPAPGTPPVKVDIRQVQIQVWISETTEQGLRDLGANLKYSRVINGVDNTGAVQQVSTNMYDAGNEFGRVTLPSPDKTLFPAPLLREMTLAGIRSIRSTHSVPHPTNAIILDDLYAAALECEMKDRES